ncbi:hypothetical protein CALCODRAFT_443477, partial [Calocera cornea HHB12733]
HGLKQHTFHGEAGAVKETNIEQARTHLKAITDGYHPCDIFNMDETGLFGRMPPGRGLATHCMSGLKSEKTRLSYAFTVNALGTERLPPLIIGKSARPICFGQKSPRIGPYFYDYWWNKRHG